MKEHWMEQRPAKRQRRQTDDKIFPPPSDSTHLSYPAPCLLLLLQPFRHGLHPFIGATSAARLIRTSRSILTSLLADYQFVDWVFQYRRCTVAEVQRSLAFYYRYRMRVLRMCLPREWNEPLVDSATGRSLLPPSLIALSLGECGSEEALVCSSFGASGHRGESEKKEGAESGQDEAESSEADRRNRPVLSYLNNASAVRQYSLCVVLVYGVSGGLFNQPIPPGALPHGLRFLQFNNHFNQPLQVGSIPDTVEALHLGGKFDQPLEVGHLPASLTHLNLAYHYDQPLLPGVLPASLLRLSLGTSFDRPILAGTLPPQLQQLSFGFEYNQPILPAAIPPSVTHLRLSDFFNQPLQLGSIPHGVVHLHLGSRFNQPLLPGVLPTSLRELAISSEFNQPLQPDSLPDGLEVLAFDFRSRFTHTLQPGVIPASVTVVIMGDGYKERLVAGGIPATVRWLRLPYGDAKKDLSGVLSPLTRVA